ncbi:hypothetical protein K492DRAFT_211824 [Lichtheimia hyalospora FSU 10163]|nr:hypothetical protein K492DRAFT_211824 [Lichtheimia hyalospora FSU 10163]
MSTPSSATASRSNSTSTASSSTTTTVNDEQINTFLTRDINHHHHYQMKWTPMKTSHPSSPSSLSLSLGQYLLITISYLAIVLLIAFVTTCLFCFFLAIRLLDDMIHTVVPERLWAIARRRLAAVDWVATLSRWSLRLASLAEWEKNRRASLYPTLNTILHRHIPERLKAIESSISPEHNHAKKRRLNLDVVENKAIEEASYLIQYTGRGWARREMLQLDNQNDHDETLLCCEATASCSDGRKQRREGKQGDFAHCAYHFIIPPPTIKSSLFSNSNKKESSDTDTSWEKAINAKNDAYAIELHHALQRIENAYMTFWDAAVRLYKMRHGRSRVAYDHCFPSSNSNVATIVQDYLLKKLK